MNKEPNIYSFNDECYVYYGDYKKEINRLNNIINELEKWLNKISKLTANIDEKMTCKNILDKLKELKENK